MILSIRGGIRRPRSVTGVAADFALGRRVASIREGKIG